MEAKNIIRAMIPTERGARRMSVRTRIATAAAALSTVVTVLTGCTPALDWRETRLDDGALTALFPCRPLEQTRTAALLGRRVTMRLQSCQAADANFAVASADVGDPADVAPALAQLQAALAANLGTVPTARTAYRVAGMTPGEQSVRLHLRGRLPDGSGADGQAVFFAKGTRVYQVVLLGKQAAGAAEAAETFFGSLRLPT